MEARKLAPHNPLFELTRAMFEEVARRVWSEPWRQKSADEAEEGLVAEGRALMRCMYEEWLALCATAEPTGPVVGAEGMERTRVRRRPRQLTTSLGVVTVAPWRNRSRASQVVPSHASCWVRNLLRSREPPEAGRTGLAEPLDAASPPGDALHRRALEKRRTGEEPVKRGTGSPILRHGLGVPLLEHPAEDFGGGTRHARPLAASMRQHERPEQVARALRSESVSSGLEEVRLHGPPHPLGAPL